MKKVEVTHYDAFTSIAGMGNPAGVIFKAENYKTEEMQEIARQIGFSECAFILPSDQADFRLRYFTPGAEVNLCGHATVASVYALFNRLDPGAPIVHQTVETKAGIIDVEYLPDKKEVTMTQSTAQFIPFEGDISALVACIGLTKEDLCTDYPIVYGSTGLWTLILPIKTLEAFSQMVPDTEKFAEILAAMPNSSIHPICLATLKDFTTLHGRHFSPAISGHAEDPITGTASGVMGAYYITYVRPDLENCDLFVEQGQEAGYDGIVHVWAKKSKDGVQVKIAGTAVEVQKLSAQI